MATLLGRYVLSTEGPVQLDYLKVNFQPKDKLIGGRVVGPLIAGSGVQVRFSLYNIGSLHLYPIYICLTKKEVMEPSLKNMRLI